MGLVTVGVVHGRETSTGASARDTVLRPGVFLFLAGAMELIASGYGLSVDRVDRTDARIIGGLRLGGAGCLAVGGLLVLHVDL